MYPKPLMKKILSIALCALSLVTAARAANATAGASASLSGTFFTGNGGWSLGTNGTPAELVDGNFEPDHQQWNFDSTWWNGLEHPENYILVNLAGTFVISALTIQADDNDWYLIQYWGSDSAWHDAWDVPPPGGWGLRTSSVSLGATITTSKLRVTAHAGDYFYAVSEISAEGRKVGGSKVPDGGSTGLMLFGVCGALALARRLRR